MIMIYYDEGKNYFKKLCTKSGIKLQNIKICKIYFQKPFFIKISIRNLTINFQQYFFRVPDTSLLIKKN